MQAVQLARAPVRGVLTGTGPPQGRAGQLSARVLPAGRRFDAWLELQVPDNSQHTSGDVFQVRPGAVAGPGGELACEPAHSAEAAGCRSAGAC